MSIYLKISNASVERIIPESSLLVQEFSGLSIDGRIEETVIEALLQLLQKTKFKVSKPKNNQIKLNALS